MKKFLTYSVFLLALGAALVSCEEDEDGGANDCYTCDSCTQNPNILNGREYCVDGFDNRSDWEMIRGQYVSDSGCTCVDS